MDRESFDFERQERWIQGQLDELQQRLFPLPVRPRQNALLPINRIPDEILLLVFAYLVQPVNQDTYYDLHGIVCVSRVCARWRRIAINEPALWTEIHACSPTQVEVFLKRSHGRPVRMYFAREFNPRHLQDIHKVLIPCIPRLRAFTLSATSMSKDIAWFMNKLQDSAPLLEELSLFLQDGDGQSGYADGIPIFGANCPALQSLTLGNIFYLPDSPFFSNLRHLTLAPGSSRWLNLFQLLRVLRRSPELERLVLRDSELKGRLERALEPVTLPRLATFELGRARPEYPHPILKHLILPETTKFLIEISRPPRASSSPKLPHAPGTLPALFGLRSLEILVSMPSSGIDYENHPFVLRADRDAELSSSPTLRLEVKHDRKPSLAWLSTLSTLLDISMVQSLTISFEGTHSRTVFSRSMWHSVLKDLRTLRTLRILAPDSIRRPAARLEHLTYARKTHISLHRHLLNALCAPEDAGGQLLCPGLEALHFEAVPCNEEFWRAMKRLATDRRAISGNPFRRVRIEDAIGMKDDSFPLVQEASALIEDLELRSSRVHGWSEGYLYYD